MSKPKFWKHHSRRPVSHARFIEHDGQVAKRVHYGFDHDGNVVLRHEEHSRRVSEEGAVRWAASEGVECHPV